MLILSDISAGIYLALSLVLATFLGPLVPLGFLALCAAALRWGGPRARAACLLLPLAWLFLVPFGWTIALIGAPAGVTSLLRSHPALAPRALLLAASVLVTLAAAEAGLRGVDPGGIGIVADANMLDDLLFDPSGGVGAPYRPSMTVSAGDLTYSTNALGLRSPEVTPQKPAGTTRVVVAGDSFTFGWGVGGPDTYVRRAERRLSRCCPIEVINAGVAHANTRSEVEYLLTAGVALDPDLLVLQWLNNDCDPEGPWDEEPRPAWLQIELPLRLLRYTLAMGALAWEALAPEDDYDAPDQAGPRRGPDPQRMCADPASERAVLGALEQLRAAPVPVRLLLLEDNPALRRWTEAAGVPHRVSVARWPPLSPSDPHPGPEGHAAISRDLVALIAPALPPACSPCLSQ